jgi:putative endonuclease
MVSHKNGSIYIGMTKDLPARLLDHQQKIDPKSYTGRKNIKRLVWFEDFDDINDAILTEKRMKALKRDWKIRLIEECNPAWQAICPVTGGFM